MTEANEIAPTELTEADYDAGFKDVPVKFRKGTTGVVRVSSIGYRKAALVFEQFATENDPWVLLHPAIEDPAILDRIDPFSAAQLLQVSCAFLFGPQFSKKLEAAGLAWLQKLFADSHG